MDLLGSTANWQWWHWLLTIGGAGSAIGGGVTSTMKIKQSKEAKPETPEVTVPDTGAKPG